MKGLLMSFLVGLGVGVIYGLPSKEPCPADHRLDWPLGYRAGGADRSWARETKINVARAASVCLVGESWGRKHPSDAN